MEQKINIAELLKDCPKGMELDCILVSNPVRYNGLDDGVYLINICTEYGTRFCLTKEGYLYALPDSKCVIFPKGKTTWEGFIPPCKFKDGDVLYVRASLQWICIYKEGGEKENVCHRYVAATSLIFVHDDSPLCHRNNIKEIRLATEEEKQKLFKTIKDNGYKWNPETKTLEKLNIPKEEPIEDKGNISDGYHTFNELYEYRLLYNASMFNELAKQGLYDVHKSKKHSDGTIPFGDENWFIVQAELPTGQISNHYEMKDWDLFQVPVKEKANLYDGHTPQDVAKRLRMFLTSDKLIEPKFKVGDKVRFSDSNTPFTISRIWWDNNASELICTLEEQDIDVSSVDLQPYKEETMEKEEKYYDDWLLTDYLEFEDNDGAWADEVEVNLGKDYEIQIRGDKTFIVKKKSQYPKTYEECAKVLLERASVRNDIGYKGDLIVTLQKLLVCRDAYWKIAGEQMGLGEPWKPDWLNTEQDKFVLYTHNNVICLNRFVLGHNVLAFPTAEMRDAFLENFKELIESCKELL